jgi:hypothetical protein
LNMVHRLCLSHPMRQKRKRRKRFGYAYQRGEIWWGRVRLAGKEHRFSLRTRDYDEAVERVKASREKLERDFFGVAGAPAKQWVYFIHDRTAEALKVGITSGIDRRFQAFKNHTPNELVLLGAIKGTRDLESLFHRFLSPFHHRGEWFKAKPAVLKFVTALIEVDRLRVA